jgi:hypothetical protein
MLSVKNQVPVPGARGTMRDMRRCAKRRGQGAELAVASQEQY